MSFILFVGSLKVFMRVGLHDDTALALGKEQDETLPPTDLCHDCNTLEKYRGEKYTLETIQF